MGEQGAVWVYAVVPGSGAAAVPAVTGIADEPVRLVKDGGLAAAVGSVSLDTVGEDALRDHLRDPVWLERTARRHHQVITTCFRILPTVPFRLGTVYRDDGRVRKLLAERRTELAAALATVTCRAEWGIQAYAVAPLPDPAEPPSATDAAGPGTAYLLHQRARRDRHDHARWQARKAAHGIDSTLADAALATRRQPLPATAPPGQTGSPVLHASYLVDKRGEADFLAATRRLADQFPDIRLRMTGPWPAYSFVEIGDEDR